MGWWEVLRLGGGVWFGVWLACGWAGWAWLLDVALRGGCEGGVRLVVWLVVERTLTTTTDYYYWWLHQLVQLIRHQRPLRAHHDGHVFDQQDCRQPTHLRGEALLRPRRWLHLPRQLWPQQPGMLRALRLVTCG